MKREQVIALAKDAAFNFDMGYSTAGFASLAAVERFASLVAAATKEDTAAMFDDSPNAEMFRQDIADQIRASIKRIE